MSQKYLICATVLSTGLLFQLPQLRCHFKKWNWKHDAVLRSRSCQCGAGLWNGPPCLAYLSVCLPAYSHLVYCQSSISLLSTFLFYLHFFICVHLYLSSLPACLFQRLSPPICLSVWMSSPLSSCIFSCLSILLKASHLSYTIIWSILVCVCVCSLLLLLLSCSAGLSVCLACLSNTVCPPL